MTFLAWLTTLMWSLTRLTRLTRVSRASLAHWLTGHTDDADNTCNIPPSGSNRGRLRRPTGLRIQADPDTPDSVMSLSTSLSDMGALVQSVEDSVLVAWNQELFIQLCKKEVKEKLGVLGMVPVHADHDKPDKPESILQVLEDSDDVFG